MHVRVFDRCGPGPTILKPFTGVANLGLSSSDAGDITDVIEGVWQGGAVGKGGPGLSDDPVPVFTVSVTKSKCISNAVEVTFDHESQWVTRVGDPAGVHVQTCLTGVKASVGPVGCTDRDSRRIEKVARVDRVEIVDQVGFDIPPEFHSPAIFRNEQTVAKVFGEFVEIQTGAKSIGFGKLSAEVGASRIAEVRHIGREVGFVRKRTGSHRLREDFVQLGRNC